MIDSLHLVYQKPTHTERYIPLNSHHHRKTITGVLRVMRDCVHNICDPSTKPKELQQDLSVTLERILACSCLAVVFMYSAWKVKRTLMKAKHISQRQEVRDCVLIL